MIWLYSSLIIFIIIHKFIYYVADHIHKNYICVYYVFNALIIVIFYLNHV